MQPRSTRENRGSLYSLWLYEHTISSAWLCIMNVQYFTCTHRICVHARHCKAKRSLSAYTLPALLEHTSSIWYLLHWLLFTYKKYKSCEDRCIHCFPRGATTIYDVCGFLRALNANPLTRQFDRTVVFFFFFISPLFDWSTTWNINNHPETDDFLHTYSVWW